MLTYLAPMSFKIRHSSEILSGRSFKTTMNRQRRPSSANPLSITRLSDEMSIFPPLRMHTTLKHQE